MKNQNMITSFVTMVIVESKSSQTFPSPSNPIALIFQILFQKVEKNRERENISEKGAMKKNLSMLGRL